MKTIGVIGTGSWGRNIIDALKTLNCKVLIANSRIPYKELLDRKPDGVIIAAHPSINLDVIQRCNFESIPVMVEKPVSLYLSDVEKISKMKIPVLVDYIHLFNRQYQAMKEQIKSPIVRVGSIGYGCGPWRDYNSLYDYGPHCLSLCMDLLPEPFEIIYQSVVPRKDTDEDGFEIETGRNFRLNFKSGDTDVHILTGNGGTEKVRKLAVFCKNGDSFTFNDDVKSKEPLTNAISHFLDVIDGAELHIPFELSLRIHRALYKLGGSKNER